MAQIRAIDGRRCDWGKSAGSAIWAAKGKSMLRRSEIRSHTGLRGLAALLVVAYHQQFTKGYRLPIETATLLFSRSYLMVDLFFILSGFVISYVYSGMRKEEVPAFLRARFARIYPLHVFALLSLTAFTLMVWALMRATERDAPSLGTSADWLRQLFLLNAWIPAKTEWNLPSWSISAEAVAYLLFPLLATSLALHPRLATTLTLVGVLLFYMSIGSSLDIVAGLAIARCLAGFGLGMILFEYRHALTKVRSSLSALQLTAVGAITVGMAAPIADPLLIPAFAALVYLTWQDRGVVARALSSRPLHWLGEISYSVYLTHFTVVTMVWFVWDHLHIGTSTAVTRSAWLALSFAAVLAASALTYNYIEKPWQDKLRRRRTAVSEAAAAAP